MSTLARITRPSLQQALGQIRLEKRAMTPVLVGAPTEQRDRASASVAQDLLDLRLGRGPFQTSQVTRHVGLPANALVEEVAQERLDRPQLLQPDVGPVLADATRPQPHHEHASAVAAVRWRVDPLGANGRGAHACPRAAATPRGVALYTNRSSSSTKPAATSGSRASLSATARPLHVATSSRRRGRTPGGRSISDCTARMAPGKSTACQPERGVRSWP